MLWQKDANNVYVNFCQEEFDLKTFEKTNLLFAFQKSPTKSNRYSLKCRESGNLLFATKQWYDAIRLYNMSLCFAENDSEHNICLAYGNRSACFLHLKMYDKCVADIRLAIQGNYPERLLPKLVERETFCLEQIERNNGQPFGIWKPELSFKVDENVAGLADVLQLQKNEEFGRHITAKCDIGAGKVVLMEKAFIASASGKYKRCDTCGKRNGNLVPCNNCTSILFCPGQCQQSPFHRIQCGMRIVHEEYVNDQQMQLLRSVLIAIEEFPSTEDLMNFVETALRSDPNEIPSSLSDTKSMYRAFLKLKFDRKTTVKETFPTQVCFMYKTILNHRAIKPKFSTQKHRRFLMHLIGHHLCIVQCNTGGLLYNTRSPYNISQSMCENLSIMVNYINHSCAPNISLISYNEFNVCITLRPIKKGGQLFVSYFRNDDAKLNTVDRQKCLQDICDFHCNCDRCENSPIHSMPKVLEEMKTDACYQYVRKNGNKMKCCTFGQNERVLRLCSCSQITSNDDKQMMQEKCIEFLNKFGRTTWTTELDFVVSCYQAALNDQYQPFVE